MDRKVKNFLYESDWREVKDGLWLLEKGDIDVFFDTNKNNKIYAYEKGNYTHKHEKFAEVKELNSLLASTNNAKLGDFHD